MPKTWKKCGPRFLMIRKPPSKGLIAACALGFALHAQAQDSPSFTDTSISALGGSHFKLDPDDQQTVTVEQAHAGAWGDTYWFVDSTRYEDPRAGIDRNNWYGEFSARLSVSKLGAGPLKVGPMRDLLLATTYERGKDHDIAEAALVGVGSDWSVPGFAYFQVNLYARKELYAGGWDAWQVTISGARPFEMGSQKFTVDGFIDYVGRGGLQHENIHVVPQMKWDLGHAAGVSPGRLWLGVELDWWRNKYGVADRPGLSTNQSAASLLLRWHF